MKKSIVFFVFIVLAVVNIAQTNKTDYSTALKLKSLENKEAKLTDRLDSLKNVPIMATDPIMLERKKIIRDSLLLSVKSEIIEVQLERKEIKAKQRKSVSK